MPDWRAMSKGIPQLHVKINSHNDGSKYLAFSRGSWSWMKISTTEARQLADNIHDLMDELEGKTQ